MPKSLEVIVHDDITLEMKRLTAGIMEFRLVICAFESDYAERLTTAFESHIPKTKSRKKAR